MSFGIGPTGQAGRRGKHGSFLPPTWSWFSWNGGRWSKAHPERTDRCEQGEQRGNDMKEVDIYCTKCGYKRTVREPVAEEEKHELGRGARQVIPACPVCCSREWTYKKPRP
jgi:hypothetical protein